MDGSMFDGVFTALVVLGIIIGLTIAGLLWATWYLLQHITMVWA